MNEEWKLIEGFNNRYKINKNGVIVNTDKVIFFEIKELK